MCSVASGRHRGCRYWPVASRLGRSWSKHRMHSRHTYVYLFLLDLICRAAGVPSDNHLCPSPHAGSRSHGPPSSGGPSPGYPRVLSKSRMRCTCGCSRLASACPRLARRLHSPPTICWPVARSRMIRHVVCCQALAKPWAYCVAVCRGMFARVARWTHPMPRTNMRSQCGGGGNLPGLSVQLSILLLLLLLILSTGEDLARGRAGVAVWESIFLLLLLLHRFGGDLWAFVFVEI